MIIPVRCFTCGKVIGSAYPQFIEMTKGGMEAKEALDKLGIERYCCRRMIISHANLIDEISPLG